MWILILMLIVLIEIAHHLCEHVEVKFVSSISQSAVRNEYGIVIDFSIKSTNNFSLDLVRRHSIGSSPSKLAVSCHFV
jgi:hypothetical protein